MSNTSTDVLVGRKRRGPQTRRRIHLPDDGDYLEPRAEFAINTLGVSDRTCARMKLPTQYIGSVAYIKHNASLRLLDQRSRPPLPPPSKHRSRKR
jgi:hypothetical protein